VIKSEIPYYAKLRHNGLLIWIKAPSSNIVIDGFDISHINEYARPVVIQISKLAHDITLRNNILHDSYNNDILKINNGAGDITIACNMFYNQGRSDEHIDINSVKNITIRDNLFFNDYAASNRPVSTDSSSFIIIKDSNESSDGFLGSKNVDVKNNIFFNWQGSHGQCFLTIGEDGKPYYEAFDIDVFNNLMLGNSKELMRSPFCVKGARDINFFNNTVVGDMPANAFAMRINLEGKNLINKNINFFNNIWSDPMGTMGKGRSDTSSDFSDTLLHHVRDFTLNNNLIWNGGNSLPSSLLDSINPGDDANLIHANPGFSDNSHLITPVYSSSTQSFADGSYSIREAFERLVYFYGIPKKQYTMKGKVTKFKPPDTDILGMKRVNPSTVGAYQVTK